MEFLAENNICGQTILHLTGIGNALIGELLRLKDYIPDVFRLESKQDQVKYGDIIMDFSYFKLTNADSKIESNPHLQDLDLEIRETYNEILSRFYLAFESVFEYVTNLNNYINELNEGNYLQYSLESIAQDAEGKQLLCESLYLYGVILMLLDIHIPGQIRERLLVSYYRYNADNTHSGCSIDDVCKLMRSTGYNPTNQTSIVQFQQQNVKNYPENYFSRVKMNEQFIEAVLETLQSDDIYNQIQKFPQNRTMALANQSAMLYVCLYFQPDILCNQSTKMREIADKFFSNNWVISLYMGVTINLIDVWEHYRAAKTALTNIFQNYLITEISTNNDKTLKKCLEQSKGLLKAGVLTQTFVMKNLIKIIKVVRECNTIVRWFVLHTSNVHSSKRSKQIYDQLIAEVNFDVMELYQLILHTSQLELQVKELLKELLDDREKKWIESKTEVDTKISDLVACFDGDKMIKIEKNENLKIWFKEIQKEVKLLDDKTPMTSERKLIQLIHALSEVLEYHNLNQNMHVKQNLEEISGILSHMMGLLTVKDAILIDLQIIGDFSYAWYLIDNYTELMQKSIKKEPNVLIKLRALFLKMATALEVPLLRINQMGGQDLVTITRYYSNELVKYIRNIVQIIPNSIFNLLKDIVDIQTNNLKELPTRLDKDKLKEFAQLDERYKIAKMTFTISVFTDGILTMKKTLVGVVELDPKQLLEDGIRKELIKNLSAAFNETLQFQNKGKNSNNKDLLVVENLTKLAKIIDGYRRSFEYIQDYLNINGLKIWQDEISRLINFNVERECNTFLRRKVQYFQSVYQSESVPIPICAPLPNDESVTFIGRLSRELLRITDPKTTIYIDLLTAWFDVKSHQELINLKFSGKIYESIGLNGLVGLDKIYSYMLVNDLENIQNSLVKKSLKEKQWTDFFQQFKTELDGRHTFSKKLDNPQRFYNVFAGKCNKIYPDFVNLILAIGHKLIWRQHIAYELNVNCKFNSKNLECSLRAFNDALIMELKQHDIDNTKPQPSHKLINELNKYLEPVGLYNPLEKIYIKTQKSSHELLLFVFLSVISNLSRIVFGKNLLKLNAPTNAPATQLSANVLKQRKLLTDSIVINKFVDGHVFMMGYVSFLKQFCGNHYLKDFVEIFCQFLLEVIEYNLSSKSELSYDTQNAINFLDQFATIAGLSRAEIGEHIPEAILNQYDFLSTTASS